MDDGMIGLLGTVLGFLLATLQQWWQKRQEEQEGRDRVRILLDHEMDFNAGLLRDVLKRVRAEDELYTRTSGTNEYGAIDAEGDPWSTLKKFQPRSLSINAWHSQLDNVPKVLSETEIRRVFQFYSNIEEIITLQEQYISLLPGATVMKDIQMRELLDVIDRLLANRPHLR